MSIVDYRRESRHRICYPRGRTDFELIRDTAIVDPVSVEAPLQTASVNFTTTSAGPGRRM
jgi:hypothetical protein